MLDIYLSSVSNRLNAVMKVLTIIATIFMPLTFIAGVYGMNFSHMPELEWRYGYGMIWGIMILISVVMLFFSRKRNGSETCRTLPVNRREKVIGGTDKNSFRYLYASGQASRRRNPGIRDLDVPYPLSDHIL